MAGNVVRCNSEPAESELETFSAWINCETTDVALVAQRNESTVNSKLSR